MTLERLKRVPRGNECTSERSKIAAKLRIVASTRSGFLSEKDSKSEMPMEWFSELLTTRCCS